MDIRKQLSVIMHQNDIQNSLLSKLTIGPNGDVHYIELVNYRKTFGEVFIDFIRGDKDNRSKLPPNTEATFPYSHVYMVKITNDGPADISFQTNRHARMIKLKAGESDIVSENENFQLTELRISNGTVNLANVRIGYFIPDNGFILVGSKKKIKELENKIDILSYKLDYISHELDRVYIDVYGRSKRTTGLSGSSDTIVFKPVWEKKKKNA